MEAINENSVNEFKDLFSGGTHAYGRSDGHSRTIKEDLTFDDYEKHLRGEISLGVIPIRKSGFCNFGAIDLDTQVNFEDVEGAIKNQNLPLLACRSKSGGAHLYTFFGGMGIQARDLRFLLGDFLQKLNLEGIERKYSSKDEVEIFPKQNQLNELEGKGNWINLPYYNLYSETEQCNRLAFSGGKYLDLEGFVLAAQEVRKLNDKLDLIPKFDENDAPPCMKPYLDRDEKVPGGHQQNYIHQASIYFKKKDDNIDVETLTQLLQNEGAQALSTPEYREGYFRSRAKAQITKEVNYSCGSLPYCNKAICKQLVCGIDARKTLKEDSVDGIYIGQLTKILTDPPSYSLFVNDREISLSDAELCDHGKFRVKAMNSINYLFQKRKENDWTDFLNEKFTKVELVDAPDDAGEVGSTRAALKEFATTAVNMKYGSDKEVYSFFKNGRAVSKDISGESYVIFKGSGFDRYCKDNKYNIGTKGQWAIARRAGFESKTVSIDGHKENCWCIETAKLNVRVEPIKDNLIRGIM